MVLTSNVSENSSTYDSPVLFMMYDPDKPTPSKMLSIGPPKQAEKPMMGAKVATEMLATKSASELPTAKMVRPMMASERPNMKPNVWVDFKHRVSKQRKKGTLDTGHGPLKHSQPHPQ